MDKKSTIGLVIIGLILAGWVMWTNYKSPEQKAAMAKEFKRKQDSVLKVEAEKKAQETAAALKKKVADDSLKKVVVTTADTSKKSVLIADSLNTLAKKTKWQDFYPATTGKDEDVTIENDKIKVTLSTRGGRVNSVVLKEYLRADRKTQVELFEKKESGQEIILNVYDNTTLSLDSLYFTADKKEVKVSGKESASIKLKMPLAKEGAYIEYVYTLKGDDYMVDYKLNFIKTEGILTAQAPVDLIWWMRKPSQELHVKEERKNENSVVFYMTSEGKSDNVNARGEKEVFDENVAGMKWVAMKQEFFSSVIINPDNFTATHIEEESYGVKEDFKTPYDDKYVKRDSVKLTLAPLAGKTSYDLKYYFGPNHYSTLKDYKLGEEDLGLEKMIPMGWSIFSYINKWLVAPVFGWFKNSSMSFGWVILILTLIIKILLLPIGWMTYKSSAKMKVLKPEIDAITEKYGKDGDQVKKQQETMALYRRAGVSPFSGCLPLVFQMFVLIALFAFFPAAIELRQKGFWWSDDLSTYDSVWDFGKVPIINSIYGDHVSLFALLMFASTIGFTYYQQKMFPNQQASMPGMKFMMYFMPFIFLSFMNSYSAGLSWYYFVANVINILQNLLLRKLISDEKLRAEVDAAMKKPQKAKSGWAQRLEQAAKERQKQIKR